MRIVQRAANGMLILMCLAAIPALAADTAPAKAPPLASPDLISLADATVMAQAALKACADGGLPTTVVIADANGFQRVALSDDNAKLIGVLHTRLKAAVVVDFKASSTELAQRLQSDAAFAEQYGKDSRYLFQPGGLPIYRDGKFVAVISVGGSGNINEECAYAGARAVSWARTEAAAE